MNEDRTRESAERAIELAEEVEASGSIADLDEARAVLHAWVDEAQAIVPMPGLGRVTIVHDDGRRSSINSSDLPFLLSGRKR